MQAGGDSRHVSESELELRHHKLSKDQDSRHCRDLQGRPGPGMKQRKADQDHGFLLLP